MAKRSKLNPRQEKFVREYVKTGNGRQSYLKAGYNARFEDPAVANPADIAAHQLLKNNKVKQAIVAHQLKHRTKHDYTVDTMLGDLEDDRQLARTLGQVGPAVQASTVKARMLGFIVDRKEVGSPGDFAALDTTQAILSLVGKELGQSVALALAAALGEQTPAQPVTIDVTPEPSEPDSDGE